MSLVRWRDLKLAIYLLDLVVVGAGSFLQRVFERVVDSVLIGDRRKVAVRRSIVAYEAFLLSGCRSCAFFTVRIAIIRPAVAARGDRYRTLADRKLAFLFIYLELLSDILSVAICHLQCSADTIGLFTNVCRTRITRLISSYCVRSTCQCKHIRLYSGCRM